MSVTSALNRSDNRTATMTNFVTFIISNATNGKSFKLACTLDRVQLHDTDGEFAITLIGTNFENLGVTDALLVRPHESRPVRWDAEYASLFDFLAYWLNTGEVASVELTCAP
jgi:hypothetical protein